MKYLEKKIDKNSLENEEKILEDRFNINSIDTLNNNLNRECENKIMYIEEVSKVENDEIEIINDININELDEKIIFQLIEDINEFYSKSNISQSDKEQILNLKNIYDSLPESYKSQIINIKDLEELIKKNLREDK